MTLVYIDDSGDQHFAVFTAVIIDGAEWRNVKEALIAYRRGIKAKDGILIGKELHACEFVKGRGRLGDKIVAKARRREIFREVLTLSASLKGVTVIGAAGPKNDKLKLFERLLNRINKNQDVADKRCILICDEGNEEEFTRLCRKLGAHNYVKSRYGAWGGGKTFKNVPTERILEDPVFRVSARSMFVQLADFWAYALLQYERTEGAHPELAKAFEIVKPICVPHAFAKDPKRLGIVRSTP